jgi:hypothetical protein
MNGRSSKRVQLSRNSVMRRVHAAAQALPMIGVG